MRLGLRLAQLRLSSWESLGGSAHGRSCVHAGNISTSANCRASQPQYLPIASNAVLHLGLIACIALVVGASGAAQNISLPLNANGEPVLPPGATTETAYVIDEFAGTGEEGFDGDGGPATQALFHGPTGIAVDPAGNVYVADQNNRRVRRIDQAGTITTYAGRGRGRPAAGEGPAVEARLFAPSDVALDTGGNLYIADGPGHLVRKVDSLGRISTVAGTGVKGSEGDGGPAVEAQLNVPSSLAVDAEGNIFIGEYGGYRVRKVDLEGTITTIAGRGTKGGSGDGGPASAAQFNFISGLAADGAGNVFVSDMNEARIRMISPSGRITTIAGRGRQGHSGDRGPAVDAEIQTPGGIAFDAAGNLFLTEFWTGRIRKIDSAGIITTVAGTGEQLSTGDMGLALDAALDRPRRVAVDSDGNLYVSENYGDRVRILRPTAELSSFRVPLGASGESVVLTVADAGALRLNGLPLVQGMEAVATNGNRYAFTQTASGAVVAEYVPNRQTVGLQGEKSVTLTTGEDGVWRIGGQVAANGYRHVEDGEEYLLEWTGAQWRLAKYTIRTIAGTVDVAEGIAATEARLFNPIGVALDSDGNAYLAEAANHRVRKIDTSGVITTLAGTGERGYAGDGGPATQAEFDSPTGIAVNWLGEVFVADYGNDVVRKIDVLGRITTIRTNRPLFNPHGLGLDLFANVLVAEAHFRNHLVRRIDSRGNVTTLAGVPGQRRGFEGGGSAAEARLNYPRAVAADTAGNVYVADTSNHRVRKIGPTGTIATFAGTGESGFSGDGGLAVDAQLSGPNGLLVDLAGNVYISDSGNHRVRRVDSSGMIETIAGPGEEGIVGHGGPATEAHLQLPVGLAMDASGNLLIADSGYDIVRKILPSGTTERFAGSGEPFNKGDGGPASMAQFGYPVDIAADAAGNVFVLDFNEIRRIDSNGMIATIATDSQRSAEMELDAAGNLYLAERFGHRVRKIDLEGTITVIAGTGEPGFSGDDGAATSAQLAGPRAIAVDSVGNVYVADHSNHRVRKIDTSGVITTFAGTGIRDRSSEFGYVASTGDAQSDYRWEPGGAALASQARLTFPAELAVDTNDILYVFDWGNRSSSDARVGKIDTTSSEPLITPLPPMSVPRFLTGFDVDDSGNVFVFSSGSVLMFDPDGSGTTIGGGGSSRFAGNGEPAAGVFLGRFANISVDSGGNIWVADSSSRRVHVLEPVQ